MKGQPKVKRGASSYWSPEEILAALEWLRGAAVV